MKLLNPNFCLDQNDQIALDCQCQTLFAYAKRKGYFGRRNYFSDLAKNLRQTGEISATKIFDVPYREYRLTMINVTWYLFHCGMTEDERLAICAYLLSTIIVEKYDYKN